VPEDVACNLCGRSDSRLLFRLRDYRLQVDEVEWNVVRSELRAWISTRPAREEWRYYPGLLR
jgi:hypothetical protein